MKSKQKKGKGNLNTSKINRIKFEDGNYARISRNALLDERLTDSSLRLLVCILNNKDTYVLNMTYYANKFGWKSNKLKTTKALLVSCGYLKCTKISLGARGFRYHYDIYEEPLTFAIPVPLISGDTVTVNTVQYITERELNNNNLNNINLKKKNINDDGVWCISNTREENLDTVDTTNVEDASTPFLNPSIEGKEIDISSNIIPLRIESEEFEMQETNQMNEDEFIYYPGDEQLDSIAIPNLEETTTPTSFFNPSIKKDELPISVDLNGFEQKSNTNHSIQEKAAENQNKEGSVAHLNGKEITKEEGKEIQTYIAKQFKKREFEFKNQQHMRDEAIGLIKTIQANNYCNFKGEIVDNWLFFTTNMINSILKKGRSFKNNSKVHSISHSNSNKKQSIYSTEAYRNLFNFILDGLKTSFQKEAFENAGGIGSVIAPIITQFGVDEAFSLICHVCGKEEYIMPYHLTEATRTKISSQFITPESLGRKYA